MLCSHEVPLRQTYLNKQLTPLTTKIILNIPPRVLNLAFGLRSLSSAQCSLFTALHCSQCSASAAKSEKTVRCVDFEMHAFKLKL